MLEKIPSVGDLWAFSGTIHLETVDKEPLCGMCYYKFLLSIYLFIYLFVYLFLFIYHHSRKEKLDNIFLQ